MFTINGMLYKVVGQHDNTIIMEDINGNLRYFDESTFSDYMEKMFGISKQDFSAMIAEELIKNNRDYDYNY